MKLFIGIASTLGGIVIGAVSVFLIMFGYPGKTEVWTAKTALQLDEGIVIPDGTELIHHRWMPEGFATIKLFINVEGTALDAFDRRVEPHYNLIIPYSLFEASSVSLQQSHRVSGHFIEQ